MQSRSVVLIAVMCSFGSLLVACGKPEPKSEPKTATNVETKMENKTENKTVTSTTGVTTTQSTPAITNVTPATATSAQSASAITASNDTPNEKGKAVYAQSCHVCHDTGTLNAPRLGDKSAWETRIAQGKDTLYQHAINGFTGKTGTMPPKGGSTAPDNDIKSAVDYMVSKAK